MPTFEFDPQVATDAIVHRTATERSGYVVIRTGGILVAPGFPIDRNNPKRLGSLIDVPYFTMTGEFQDFTDIDNDVDFNEGTPSLQQSTVGIAPYGWTYDDWTRMSMGGVGDPYGKLANWIGSKWDLFVARKAIAEMNTSALTYDGTSGIITYDGIVRLLGLFNDQDNDVACIMVHSKVRNDLRRIKDSTGNPILLEYSTPATGSGIAHGDVGMLFGKYPVMVSDLCRVVNPGGGGALQYTTYAIKKNALIFWYDREGFNIQTFDIIAKSPTQHTYKIEPYYAIHRYDPFPDSSLTGVALLRTQASLA